MDMILKTQHQMLANNSIAGLVSRSFPGSAPIYPWNINSIVIHQDGLIHADGWAVPMDGLLDNTFVYCNNSPPASIIWSNNDTVATTFLLWPNSRSSAFTATWQLGEVCNDPSLIFDVRDAEGQMLPPQYRIYFPNVLTNQFKIPDQTVMESIGATHPHLYLQAGYTLAQGLNRVLATVTGQQFSSQGTVLDWGCGSARVSQHVLRMMGKKDSLYGVDVDARAIEWCHKHVPELIASVCDLHPPTLFSNESFDVVYAYSVLTHLREDDARSWIAEVWRLLKPGGYFMFTTLGGPSLTWLFPKGNPEIASALLKKGIYDDAKNDNIDSVIKDQSYYRNTWVTDEYVRKVWGSEYLYCYHETSFHFYQDIHVLRKP